MSIDQSEDQSARSSSAEAQSYSAPLEELLHMWMDVEPSQCKRSQHTPFWETPCGSIATDKILSDDGLARIVRAVQLAAEADGYNWSLSKKGVTPDGDWQRFAQVWHPHRSGPGGTGMSTRTNAHALLEAYLEAKGAL